MGVQNKCPPVLISVSVCLIKLIFVLCDPSVLQFIVTNLPHIHHPLSHQCSVSLLASHILDLSQKAET